MSAISGEGQVSGEERADGVKCRGSRFPGWRFGNVRSLRSGVGGGRQLVPDRGAACPGSRPDSVRALGVAADKRQAPVVGRNAISWRPRSAAIPLNAGHLRSSDTCSPARKSPSRISAPPVLDPNPNIIGLIKPCQLTLISQTLKYDHTRTPKPDLSTIVTS